MKLFLCRHGETTGDVEDRYGGDYDDHLTEKGKAQARELVSKINNSEAQIILSSPLIRAKETADILGEVFNLNVQVVQKLKERNSYGILSGMARSEAMQKYPEQVEMLKDTKVYTLDRAENYPDFKNRVCELLEELEALPYQSTIVVTHAGVIREIFRTYTDMGEINLVHGCTAKIELLGGKVKILSLDGITPE